MPPELAFVLGTGRCGSTLVHEVLARHPAMAFVSNVQDRVPLPAWAGRWNNQLYARVPERFTTKGRLRFAPSEGYRLLEREVSSILSAPARDLTAGDVTPWLERRTRALFEAHARAQNLPVFLHKFTGWPRARFLQRVFPEARFVHVIRDGRAVANSFLQMPWWRGYAGPDEWGWGPLSDPDRAAWEGSGRNFAVLAGLEWKLLLEAFELAKAEVQPGRWLEIRYEDFVAQPREMTADLLGFLGLEWNATFERGFAGYAFREGRTAAFRKDLGMHDLDQLERCLAETLERYGYAVRPGQMSDDGTDEMREDSGL
jgi:hypothetical protein